MNSVLQFNIANGGNYKSKGHFETILGINYGTQFINLLGISQNVSFIWTNINLNITTDMAFFNCVENSVDYWIFYESKCIENAYFAHVPQVKYIIKSHSSTC